MTSFLKILSFWWKIFINQNDEWKIGARLPLRGKIFIHTYLLWIILLSFLNLLHPFQIQSLTKSIKPEILNSKETQKMLVIPAPKKRKRSFRRTFRRQIHQRRHSSPATPGAIGGAIEGVCEKLVNLFTQNKVKMRLWKLKTF